MNFLLDETYLNRSSNFKIYVVIYISKCLKDYFEQFLDRFVYRN